MRLKLIRDRRASKEKHELLLEVDEELLELYRSETGEDDFNQDSFSGWVNDLMKYALESDDWTGEDWKYGE